MKSRIRQESAFLVFRLLTTNVLGGVVFFQNSKRLGKFWDFWQAIPKFAKFILLCIQWIIIDIWHQAIFQIPTNFQIPTKAKSLRTRIGDYALDKPSLEKPFNYNKRSKIIFSRQISVFFVPFGRS